MALRAALFALLWWILTGTELSSWVIGVPVILATTAISLIQVPHLRLPRLSPLPAFIAFFLRESVLGGIDVIRRAFHPSLPLRPGFVTVSLAGLGERQRLFFLVVLNLLPGTLSARLDNDRLLVHVLDRAMPVAGTIERLQDRIAEIAPRQDEPGGGFP